MSLSFIPNDMFVPPYQRYFLAIPSVLQFYPAVDLYTFNTLSIISQSTSSHTSDTTPFSVFHITIISLQLLLIASLYSVFALKCKTSILFA